MRHTLAENGSFFNKYRRGFGRGAAIILITFLLGGCVYITHYKDLMFLGKLAANQREIDNYLKKQEKLFHKLEGDVKNSRLKKGISKEAVLSEYGEPVFCKSVESSGDIVESCLYRHPTEYFDTDVVYLKFDKDEKLYFWEFIPAVKP